MAAPTSDEVQLIINHVFLPPKVPQKEDESSDCPLISATLKALTTLRDDLLPAPLPAAIDYAISAISSIKQVNSLPGGMTDETELQRVLIGLQKNHTMGLKISSQNAAVLITKKQDELIFEVFELSPRNEDVIATKGRIHRVFPANAVAVNANLLEQADFTSMIAHTLSTMCHQTAPGMQPKSKKAGAGHDEYRDTTSPAMVSELLIGMLSGIGESFPTSTILKKMRDEVCYFSAKAPWRRSPMWLLIRVALQLVLTRSVGGSHHLYKVVMLSIMGYLLPAAKSMPVDILYIMNAKIARRLHKLSKAPLDIVGKAIVNRVNIIARESAMIISKRWKKIQQLDAHDLDLSTLATLDFEKDSIVDIPALDKYIQGLKSRQHDNSSTRFVPTSELVRFADRDLPELPTYNSSDTYYAGACLQSFEHWVTRHLPAWLDNYEWPDSCEKLSMLSSRYHLLAHGYYRGNPEAVSNMILTIFELWVACDKAAVRVCPLLAKYDPGIPPEALQSLLLKKVAQLQRLAKVEEYLNDRACSSVYPTDFLFDTRQPEAFAARYYDQSEAHQSLLSLITSNAEKARRKKLEEFRTTVSEYNRLDALYSRTEHYRETIIIDRWCDPPETKEEHVDSKCDKCRYESQRKKLSITVHEWPLPERSMEAKIVVFELQVPAWYSFWRSSRFYLLQDVLKGSRPKANLRADYRLGSNDPHLTMQHFIRNGTQRIGLLSEAKPVCSTHYRSKNIANLNESDVCVRNGLQYQYFNTSGDHYVGTLAFKDDIPRACTYTLSRSALQQYIFRPASEPDGVASNVVIASQDACPASMTLQEFAELSTIPLGHHIQWPNIALQLVMPGVDFKKVDTALVILHCIYQAGPPSYMYAPLREAHDVLNDDAKAALMVENLTVALQRVKENWESAQALSIFIAIAARILSLNEHVKGPALAFLENARRVAVSWMQSLREKAHAATEHGDRTAFVNKAVEVALICVSTYDVDRNYLESILKRSSNVSVLVQASIVVHEGEHNQGVAERERLALLTLQFKQTLFHTYAFLANDCEGIDDAIKKAWSGYAPSTYGWTAGSNGADNWLTTDTAGTHGTSMQVHYNLLSGELLVNGMPLDQPPKTYRNHSMYSVLFGKAVVEVMPASSPGFQFSTKRAFEGCEVQLGLTSAASSFRDELVVQAKSGKTTFETIPKSVFEAVFPSPFVQDYVHWYDHATNTVLFRPAQSPWKLSAAQWALVKSSSGWQLSKNGSLLLGLHSKTSKAISDIFDPLTDREYVHNILHPTASALQIDIPRLRHSFLLSKGSSSLQSKEFPTMQVDADQSLGTLIGFANKLILRSKAGKRSVLILESNVVYSRYGEHIAVAASKNSSAKLHALQVNDLGRLLDNGDLGCKLYMAYLHALTSFCIPDVLTRKTGTEQALSILTSAAMRSFDQLSQENADMLGKIASLSPGRRYYPEHERVMQTVDWDSCLSFLSQHSGLKVLVSKILEQAEGVKIFYPDHSLELPRLPKVDEHLQKRDDIRSSTFRTSGFGAEDHTTVHDTQYSSRDRGIKSQRAINSALMAGLFSREGRDLHCTAPASGRLWQLLCEKPQIHGPTLPIESRQMKYDAKLMQDGFGSAMSKLPALLRWMNVQQNMRQNKFTVMMWLSTMAFNNSVNLPDLQILGVLSKLGVSPSASTSAVASFQPKAGTTCSKAVLRTVVDQNRRDASSYPEWTITRRTNEQSGNYNARRHAACQAAFNAAAAKLVDAISNQWPGTTVSTPPFDVSKYINVDAVVDMVRKRFKIWHSNGHLQHDVNRIEQALTGCIVHAIQLPSLTRKAPTARTSLSGFTSESDLFSQATPQLPANLSSLGLSEPELQSARLVSTPLSSLVQRLEDSVGQSRYEKEYAEDLKRSLQALLDQEAEQLPVADWSPSIFLKYLNDCRRHAEELYGLLVAAVRPSSILPNTQIGYQWPRISPLLFLGQLSRTRWQKLPHGWKLCIVEYGVALTAVHRAERLVQLSEPLRKEDLVNELRNSGHEHWSPMDYPDSLLIEVESGIMIRDVQERIAAQMRKPSNNANCVMQLQMGEGKSSVIAPIASAALADYSQLVRVIVAKPQSKQMAMMLISKLGGLVDRRVYYLPFSRSLRLDRRSADAVYSMLEECKANGGVLLVQPEHILSFQLMGPECYITGNTSVGQSLVATQDFLDTYSRDIVDESDENFSARFELIYTMGMQRTIELSGDRWFLLQQLLDLVRQIAPKVAEDLPLSLEISPGASGSFPRARILRSDAGELLARKVADRICKCGLNGFQISRQPDEVRRAVFTYITKFELDVDEIDAVEKGPFWTDDSRSPLLLLRGIIAGGVLAFALGQKRWRVNYGLTTRTPPTKLAVPYRAKDSPSPRSEFSHPDVVITLTCLCYYYDGLSDEDLFVALGHLMDSDQADIEYQAWVKDACNLPSAFTQLQGINLKDRPQCVSELFPALRYGKNVVDYFLSHHVFNKEMKEFPDKLSASGWDIGKRKERLCTGFSGTLDSRRLLPLDVRYLDLKQQKHTNALVLHYLLQPENSVEIMARPAQQSSDAANLLETVSRLAPPVQVILDVGAQILELNNAEVARTWLQEYNSDKEAVVYVNDSDELCVVDRHGRRDLLQTSSYATRLDSCLVFLDEAHTRGIDLKLPLHYRAIVTLGANLTKDRLVQAAMRMRKLGKGQTVVFAISEEIQAKILDCTSKAKPDDITVEDVLLWSISETHTEIRRSMPLWAVQGERFVRQQKLRNAVHHNGKTTMSREHAEEFQEEEAQSLDDRYRPRQSSSQPAHLADATDTNLKRIAARCAEFDDLQFNSSTLQEEQERELSPEVQQERHVQRAPPADPARHDVHPDVRAFATTGASSTSSSGYTPAFETLRDSSAAKGQSSVLSQLSRGRKLFVTADFARTVKKSGGSYVSDVFQRPVQWILTTRLNGSDTVDRILIISPHEANALYTSMKTSMTTTLHAYKPRCNSGYGALDSLDFWTVSANPNPPMLPRALAAQLNLFAGQLYISSYEDYLETCKFLGLSTKALTRDMSLLGWEVDANGFILKDGQGRVGGESGLKKSPVNIFKTLMSTIRRSGDNISKTQMGGVLEGKLFEESEFAE